MSGQLPSSSSRAQRSSVASAASEGSAGSSDSDGSAGGGSGSGSSGAGSGASGGSGNGSGGSSTGSSVQTPPPPAQAPRTHTVATWHAGVPPAASPPNAGAGFQGQALLAQQRDQQRQQHAPLPPAGAGIRNELGRNAFRQAPAARKAIPRNKPPSVPYQHQPPQYQGSPAHLMPAAVPAAGPAGYAGGGNVQHASPHTQSGGFAGGQGDSSSPPAGGVPGQTYCSWCRRWVPTHSWLEHIGNGHRWE